MRKPIPVGEKAETLRKGNLERDKGIEPSPRPWQGRVLPLYESRNQRLTDFGSENCIVFALFSALRTESALYCPT